LLHFENILTSSVGDHVFHEGTDVQQGIFKIMIRTYTKLSQAF
jgi:hypothetical protein